LDYTPEEITALLSLAAKLKAQKKAGIPHDGLRGKNVALIFEKTSTRTRCSFEVAAHDLGMGTSYLDPAGTRSAKRDPSPIRPGCLLRCLTVSSTAASARLLCRSLPTPPRCRSGTA